MATRRGPPPTLREIVKLIQSHDEEIQHDELALHLGVPGYKVSAFEHNHNRNVERVLQEVLKHFLANSPRETVWNELAMAFRAMGKGNLADECERRQTGGVQRSNNQVQVNGWGQQHNTSATQTQQHDKSKYSCYKVIIAVLFVLVLIVILFMGGLQPTQSILTILNTGRLILTALFG